MQNIDFDILDQISDIGHVQFWTTELDNPIFQNPITAQYTDTSNGFYTPVSDYNNTNSYNTNTSLATTPAYDIIPYLQQEELDTLKLVYTYNKTDTSNADLALIGGSASRLYLLSGIMEKHNLTFEDARKRIRDTHDMDFVYFNEATLKKTLDGYNKQDRGNKYTIKYNGTHIDAFKKDNYIGTSGLIMTEDQQDRIEYIDVSGISCPVVAKEDIIATKLRVKDLNYLPRDNDISDVANMIALYADELDINYLAERISDTSDINRRINYLKTCVVNGTATDLIYSPADTFTAIEQIETTLKQTKYIE
ncbi:MAG: hypothetical protein K0B02_03620 [DPANN group archaeon]|nr:hypothetical protein [DPANN group archaeon]